MARWIMAAALSVMVCGCARDALVGRWTASSTQGALQFTTTMTFGSDGALTVTDSGAGACAGARSYTGVVWTASHTTAMTVTFSGVGLCTGAIVCTVAGVATTLGCPTEAAQRMTGACGYTLSNDDNSLVLSDCSGHSGTSTTYTRAAD